MIYARIIAFIVGAVIASWVAGKLEATDSQWFLAGLVGGLAAMVLTL